MTGPKKYLGQHFLTAPATAKKIADAVPAHARERVLEIGPGRGALTVHLIERFPGLHLVEVDKDAVKVLRERFANADATDATLPSPVIHNEDVLSFDFAKAGLPLHVVGNLPYNIGAHIIRKSLLFAPDVLSCTFMVQKEVATRVVSGPHCKDNGWLSVFSQFFGAAKLLFNVPPGSFFPRPNVDSAVFRIIVDKDVEKKLERARWEDFFSFVDAGFSMRRKQAAKVLALKYGREKDFYCAALSDIGIEVTARAEDLDVGMWLDLYERVCRQ